MHFVVKISADRSELSCFLLQMQIDKDCWNKVLSWLGPQTQSPNFVVQFPPP